MISWSRLLTSELQPHDDLRYSLPARSIPKIVVWNTTSRCNLSCKHCYFEATENGDPDELTQNEAKDFIEDLARLGVPVLLFSGGEPLLRKDIFELGRIARDRGIRPVLSTNGTLINESMAEEIKDAGFSYVGVSLDGMQNFNDWFRCKDGAFSKALAGIRNCQQVGLKAGLRFTITRDNLGELPHIFDLVEAESIPRLCLYHLVYTGRGRFLKDKDTSQKEKRETMELIWQRTLDFYQRGLRIEILTVDNHADGAWLYVRLKKSDPKRAERTLKLLELQGGNSSGINIGAVDNRGDIYADQFWRSHPVGNVRRVKFSDVWSGNGCGLLHALRNRKDLLKGRCQRCNFLKICNGNFRARAEAVSGDPWAEDPACYLSEEEITQGEFSARSNNIMCNKELRLIFWETTRACNLECPHCRASTQAHRSPLELTTNEAKRFIEQAASFSKPILVFSGGEPLLREDIYELAKYATDLGLKATLATNATLITKDVARKLKESRIEIVAVSIYGSSREAHDRFCGKTGAFKDTLMGIENLKESEIPLQINTTITKKNLDELESMGDFALEQGAVAYHVFFLVPTGRGKYLEGDGMSPWEYEGAFNRLYDFQLSFPLHIKATCAPHYYRVVRQRSGERVTKGCLAGQGVCFVSHKGEVFGCGYLPISAGDLRKQDFKDIWFESELFNILRDDSKLQGRCGVCEFKKICGGCRARAYTTTDNYLNEDTTCLYQPLTARPH